MLEVGFQYTNKNAKPVSTYEIEAHLILPCLRASKKTYMRVFVWLRMQLDLTQQDLMTSIYYILDCKLTSPCLFTYLSVLFVCFIFKVILVVFAFVVTKV